MGYLGDLFDLSRFMPHGNCFLWRPDLLVLHVGSDLLIATAYFSIPAAIVMLLRIRPDAGGGVARLFIAFIAFCGLTHLASIVVIWYPAYAIEGLLKFGTASVSIATAIMLWMLIPKAAAMPSRGELEQRNLEIQELNRKLQQRIDSLGTLAGGVSHDFNNLLTVIKGHAQMLEEPAEPELALHNVKAISDAADRATDVCRQMLAYSGRGHFMLAATDLNEVVNSVALPHDPLCDFKYSLSGSINTINASREQIEQLITDLCTNAMEAIRESSLDKGEIVITTCMAELSRDELDAAAFPHDLQPGEAVVLEVSDNGVGMSHRVVERIFEPYYSTKFTGRGLGMAAVQGIVRGHNGCIFIESELGEGTTVRVAFPVKQSATARYRPPRVRHPQLILVVDDEPDILSVARDYLATLGITALTTSDSGEAIRLTRKHRDRLDVVIIDYLMPYITGSELLAQIAEIREVDAYLTSGYSRGEIDDPIQRKLLTGFIAKPFDLEDLRRLFT